MIEQRVRLLPAREWLEHVDAMYLPVTIDKRLQVADWAFEPFLATVENVCLLTNDWLLLSQDGCLLTQGLHPSLTCKGGKKSDFFRQAGRDEAVVTVPGQEVAVEELAVLIGNCREHWHWLTDHLPRFYTVRKFPQLSGLRFVVGNDLTRQQRESLALLGVGPQHLMQLDYDKLYRFKSLWVPSVFTENLTPHPFAIQWLRRTFRTEGMVSGRKSRLFLSRRDAPQRHLINEDEIAALLAEYGFETLVAGELSFGEQVRRFANAEFVVAVTGSNMANVLFSPKGTRLIELHNFEVGADFIVYLAEVLGQRYARVTGRVVPDAGRLPHNFDFEVDPALARQTVERMLAESAAGP
jgi:capsular polysaccharide biosynthesis protein